MLAQPGLSAALLAWREESIALGLLLVQVVYERLSITLVDIGPAPG